MRSLLNDSATQKNREREREHVCLPIIRELIRCNGSY